MNNSSAYFYNNRSMLNLFYWKEGRKEGGKGGGKEGRKEGTCLFDNTTIYNNYLTAQRIGKKLSLRLNKAPAQQLPK